MWILIANKCTQFYAKRLSPIENVVERRGGGATFFDSPCGLIDIMHPATLHGVVFITELYFVIFAHLRNQ